MSSTFTAMAPTLDVVSPPLQPHCQQPNSAVLASWGQGRGQGRGDGACHGYREKVGQWQDEGWVGPLCPGAYHCALEL